MRNNHVRAKLRMGRPTIGCFLRAGSPTVAEQMAHCDFIVIETEHKAIEMAQV